MGSTVPVGCIVVHLQVSKTRQKSLSALSVVMWPLITEHSPSPAAGLCRVPASATRMSRAPAVATYLMYADKPSSTSTMREFCPAAALPSEEPRGAMLAELSSGRAPSSSVPAAGAEDGASLGPALPLALGGVVPPEPVAVALCGGLGFASALEEEQVRKCTCRATVRVQHHMHAVLYSGDEGKSTLRASDVHDSVL